MKADKEQLLHDLLAGESRGETTVLAAAGILRRRRQGRAARRAFALLTLVAVAGLLVERNAPRQTVARVSPAKHQPAAPLQAQGLTDEQLLALFPNTPVGLATLPNGKKLLLFPRAADQARYVTRL